MQVLDENGARPGVVVLVRRRPTRAVALAGGVGALLALVPLYIAPGFELLRFVTFLVLGGASVALVRLGLSRPEHITLASTSGGLTWGQESLPPPAYVALRGDGSEEPPRYQAVVGWPDGRERVALERSEPGALLCEAFALAGRLELELRPGWGLERHFPESGFVDAWKRAALEAPDGPQRTQTIELTLWPVQKKTAAICLSSGFFVPLVTAVLARSPDRSVTASALELVLTGLSSAAGIALGALFWGLRRRFTVSGGRLRSTLAFFGKPFGAETDVAPASAPAFAVTPDGDFVRHVLFAAGASPISIVADPEGAARLGAHAERPLVSERPAPKLPLVTSARYRRPDRPARLRS